MRNQACKLLGGLALLSTLTVGCQTAKTPRAAAPRPSHSILKPIDAPPTSSSENKRSSDASVGSLPPEADRPVRLVSVDQQLSAEPDDLHGQAEQIKNLSSSPPTNPANTLDLDEVIHLTLEANPDIHSALQQIRLADATLMRARAEFYPTLGVSENYGVTDNPSMAFMYQLNQAQLTFNQDFNHPRVTDNFDTRLRYQHRLYAGGRRLAEWDGATFELGASRLGLAAVQNQLIFRAAEAYYRLLQADELVRVRQEAVGQVQRHLEIVEARFRAQTAVKSDVLSVQVRLAEVREALITALNQVTLAWAVLENVTGVPLDQQPLPDRAPQAPWSERVEQIQTAVGDALARRPELGQLSNQRMAALSGVEAARSGKRLAVDFVTDYDVYTGDFRRGNDTFFTGLVVSLNLFDGGRTTADVCKAIARVRDLTARHRRAMLDIELDVRRSHLQLKDAQERLNVATQAIEQARESLREIEVRYRGQTATITQLLDAQVALSNAQVRQANARAEVEVAGSALQRAIGRLTDAVGA